MKKCKSLVSTFLILAMFFSLTACGGSGGDSGSGSAPSGGGSAPSGGGSAPTGGNAASGSGSAAAPSNTGGVAAHSLDDYVSYTFGVTDFLGRFIQGLVPTESWTLCDAVYDQILKVDPKTKQIYSDCLEDWYYEDDVTLIMKLKENVYFSNGMHATAADVLYSYTSAVDRGSTQLNSFGPIIWDACHVRDEYTAVFKFDMPYRVFLNQSVHLICKEWSLSLADGWEDMAWYKPVGSGAYEVVEYSPEEICILHARDHYWNEAEVGPTYVDEWIFKFYKDSSTMYMDLELGNLQFAEAQPVDFSRYVRNGKKGDGFDLFMIPTGVTQYFCFSFYDYPIWNDKRLREAVAIGVNWEELGTVTFEELFSPADSILPKAAPLHISPGKYEYNPERAKALLVEAGYGPDNPLKLYTTLHDVQQYKALGENMQFQLTKIGMEVEVVFLDVMTGIQVWNADGGTDFGFWWRISGSPSFDLYENIPNATREVGSTYTRVLDPKFRELWGRMVYSTDPAVYEPAIKELQQYNFDEIIYIPYYEFTAGFGYRTDIFSEDQLRNFIYGSNMYQVGRLGLLSAWK